MREGFRRTIGLAVALSALGAALAPGQANAMSERTRAFLRTGAYGMLGGTALGLAQYPFTHRSNNIFVGTSVGLYLGLAMGLYYAANGYETPRHLVPTGPDASARPAERDVVPLAGPSSWVRLEAPILRF